MSDIDADEADAFAAELAAETDEKFESCLLVAC